MVDESLPQGLTTHSLFDGCGYTVCYAKASFSAGADPMRKSLGLIETSSRAGASNGAIRALTFRYDLLVPAAVVGAWYLVAKIFFGF
jgi:hypothetical protein